MVLFKEMARPAEGPEHEVLWQRMPEPSARLCEMKTHYLRTPNRRN